MGSLPVGNVDQPLSVCYCFPWEMWTSHCSSVLFYGKCGLVIVPVCCFMGSVDQSLSLWCCFPWEMWTRQTSLNHWDRQTTCRFSCTSKALTITNTECCISFVFVLYSLLVILSEKRTELCTNVGYCIYVMIKRFLTVSMTVLDRNWMPQRCCPTLPVCARQSASQCLTSRGRNCQDSVFPRRSVILREAYRSRLFPDASLVKASAPESRSATQVAPLEISDSRAVRPRTCCCCCQQ